MQSRRLNVYLYAVIKLNLYFKHLEKSVKLNNNFIHNDKIFYFDIWNKVLASILSLQCYKVLDIKKIY